MHHIPLSSSPSMSPSLSYTIHFRFNQALVIVRSIPEQEVGLQPIPTDRLKFYALYKQATFGKCNTTQPPSRNEVERAKWKAWYRVRHYNCLEAKTRYVNLVVDLLVEFINRYPNNPHHKFAKQALHSLEPNGCQVTDYAREAKSVIPVSPIHGATSTYYSNNSSMKSPLLQASTAPSSVTITHQNDNDPDYRTPSKRMMSMGMDLATSSPTHSNQEQYWILSSTTASSKKDQRHQQNKRRISFSSIAERKTLEKLHMDIAALTNQMNHLGQDILRSYDGPRIMRHHGMIRLGWRLVKTLLKHVLVNTLVTGVALWLLWHQKFTPIQAWIPHIILRSSVKKMISWNQV